MNILFLSETITETVDMQASLSASNDYLELRRPCPPQIENSAIIKIIDEGQQNETLLMQISFIFAVLIYLLVSFDESSYYMV